MQAQVGQENNQQGPQRSLFKLVASPWLVWGLAALFFFAEYFARVAPSVMVPELMTAFSVNATALGSLSAFFYYAYVSMQIPVGMLVDRYGPHKLLTAMALLCGIAAFLFAHATSIVTADASRFLMGFSAAFAFVGSLKLASVWFPARRFGLLAGLSQALGMLGAAVGEAPMALMVVWVGWRHTMLVVALILILLAILIGLIVRDFPSDYCQTKISRYKETGLAQSFKQVVHNPQSWINGIYVGFLYAPTAIFAELWGVQFLKLAYNVSTPVAAGAISIIFIGWLFGGPLVGWISDSLRLRRPVMLASAICGLILLSLVIYVPSLPFVWIYVLLFIYGLTNAGVSISYAVASEINQRSVAGTSMAFANMASVIIGAIFQPLIGWFLDLQWTGVKVAGIPFYSAAEYRVALFAVPIFFLISILCCFFIKETHCHSIEIE